MPKDRKNYNEHEIDYSSIIHKFPPDAAGVKILIENRQHNDVIDLVRENELVNEKDQNNKTPLHYCIQYGNIELYKELINFSPDLTIVDGLKNSYLHYAAMYNQDEILEELLKTGVSVDLQNNDNNTALHLALLNGYYEISKQLIDFRPNKDIINSKGETYMHCLPRHNTGKFTGLLIDKGFSINDRDIYGNTPLFLQAFQGNYEAVVKLSKEIKKMRLKINVKNHLGISPIKIAQLLGNENIYKFLLDYVNKISNENL